MQSGAHHDADGWAELPTGARLGARLADIDRHDVEDEPLLALLTAQARQLGYQQAQVWAVMAELATRDPQPWAMPQLSPEQVFDCAADEIRAELLLTRRAAVRELARAEAVCAQPRVFAALERGELDRARAIVLADGVADLTPDQAATLLDKLLPEASTRTVTGLADRVRTVAVALDPGWAERRYRQAVRERRVIGYLNPDGSATVSGQYLPADAAAAACDRVDALAAAAKRAGAHAPLDHLRAELFLALLDGRYQHLNTDQIITALRTQYPADTHATDTNAPDADAAETPDPATSPHDSDHPEQHASGGAVAAAGAGRGVALKVGLGTLLGLDEQPGEIPGWGPVTASVARAIAARQHDAQWRFAVLDPDGRLLFDATTRHRPRALRDPAQAAGGTVELHVPAALLAQPGLADTHPAWARLLTDLAAQYDRQRPIQQDPAARFAGRPLRRRSQLTHQRCVFPGCRRPATDCDLDRHKRSAGTNRQQRNRGPPWNATTTVRRRGGGGASAHSGAATSSTSSRSRHRSPRRSRAR